MVSKEKKYLILLWHLIPPRGFPEVFLVTANKGKKITIKWACSLPASCSVTVEVHIVHTVSQVSTIKMEWRQRGGQRQRESKTKEKKMKVKL